MNNETRNLFAIFIVTIILIIGAAFLFTSNTNTTDAEYTNEGLIGASKYSTGSANPKVVIVEFSDFECPACIAVQPIVDEVLRTYPDKVKLVYKNFPLPQHALAQKAAEALESAGAEGKYWEMHKELFAANGKIGIDELPKIAEKIGLSTVKLNDDLRSNKYAGAVAADVSDGRKFQIRATPTFFVNGKRIVGGETLLAEVDSAISKN